jgi:hypothetical protein
MLFLERNNKLLSEYQPEVYKKFASESNLNFPNIDVGFGKNDNGEVDNVIVKIGDKLYIDSKGTDADNYCSLVNPDIHTVIILGFGLAYHLEKIVEKHPDKKIIVIEPDKRMLFHAFHLKDMETVIRNVEIWLDEDINTIKMKIYEMLTHPLARGIQFIPYVALHQPYSNDLIVCLQKLLNDWSVMVNTKRCLVEAWYKNRFENIKKPSANAKNLIGKFKNIPAVLVGAGPSLKNQLDMLKSLQNKAVIIAASTAVEILESNNIKPTFSIAIDQDPVTSGGLHENLNSDVPLLYDGQVAQNSLNYKGKKFQFALNVNRYSNIVIPDLPVIESGPSVANVALDFLYKIECSPILIIGLDLSYTYNKLYCDGTKFNQDINHNGLRMINNKGEMCATEPSFISMRNWYEEYAERVKPNVYNCTETGLPIKNIPNADFTEKTKDFLHTYDFESIINECFNKEYSNYLNINKKIIEELEQVKHAVMQNGRLTSDNMQLKAWSITEEFSQSLVYLEEIRCENNIKKGMEKAEAIKIFQNKRQNIILDSIEKIRNLL